MNIVDNDKETVAARSFLNKVKNLQRKANLALYSIVSLLILSVLIVIYTSDITKRDLANGVDLEDLYEEKIRLEERKESYERAYKALTEIHRGVMSTVSLISKDLKVVIPSKTQINPNIFQEFLLKNPDKHSIIESKYREQLSKYSPLLKKRIESALGSFTLEWGVTKYKFEESHFSSLTNTFDYWRLVFVDLISNQKKISEIAKQINEIDLLVNKVTLEKNRCIYVKSPSFK